MIDKKYNVVILEKEYTQLLVGSLEYYRLKLKEVEESISISKSRKDLDNLKYKEGKIWSMLQHCENTLHSLPYIDAWDNIIEVEEDK